MSWTKLDDRFPTHPKILGLSDGAFRLYVTALCYSAEHLTDGWIPPGFRPDEVRLAELIAANLWSERGEGWQIHDYLEWNPARSKVMEGRARDAERKKRGRVSRWSPEGIQQDVRMESDGPVPVPVPIDKPGFTVAAIRPVDNEKQKRDKGVVEDKADPEAVASAVAQGRDLLKAKHRPKFPPEDAPT